MQGTYENYWAYQKIKEAGWPIKVNKKSVVIYFDKKRTEVYARFELVHYNIKDLEADLDFDGYVVRLDGENLEDCFDYASRTWDQAVKNACYYFVTRF